MNTAGNGTPAVFCCVAGLRVCGVHVAACRLRADWSDVRTFALELGQVSTQIGEFAPMYVLLPLNSDK